MAGYDPYLTSFGFDPLDYDPDFGIKSFKSEEPTPEAGVFELRLRRRHQVVVVGTRSNGTVESLGLMEDTHSLDIIEGFNIHYHILKSPKSLEKEVDQILDYLELNPYHCKRMRPLIVSNLIDASKHYGFNNFVVAAKVDLVRTKVIHDESLARLFWDMEDDCNESLARLLLENSKTEVDADYSESLARLFWDTEDDCNESLARLLLENSKTEVDADYSESLARLFLDTDSEIEV